MAIIRPRCARTERGKSQEQWHSQGGGGGGGWGVGGGGGAGGGGGGARGPWPPPKLLVVNFPIILRCYVLLGCRVINVILKVH